MKRKKIAYGKEDSKNLNISDLNISNAQSKREMKNVDVSVR